MYEYSSDKILQRQKVCNKCHSFVTHEKVEDNVFSCPLCGKRIPPVPNYERSMPLEETKRYIKNFYDKFYERVSKKQEKKK